MHTKLQLALEAAGLEPEYQLGADYRCPCPNCGSHDNLAVRWNSVTNRVQAHCWSCGSHSLYPEKELQLKLKRKEQQPKESVAEPPKATFNPDAELVETYYYTDPHGKCWTQKHRYQPALRSRDSSGAFDRKDFLFEYREERVTIGRTSGNEYRTVAWVSKKPLGFSQNYIYAFPLVLSAISRDEFVFLVDGEKDADEFNRCETSPVATCAPFGDKAFPQWAVAQLSGAKLVIVADRDAVGYRSALEKAKLLRKQTYAIAEASVGKDTYDHYRSGGTYRSMIKLPVAELIERAKG